MKRLLAESGENMHNASTNSETVEHCPFHLPPAREQDYYHLYLGSLKTLYEHHLETCQDSAQWCTNSVYQQTCKLS